MTSRARSLRLLTYTTVFGVVWGAVEMMLGSYLHLIRFPCTGAVLAGIGAVVLCVERSYTPVFRASLYTGAIAVAFKFMSPGSVRLVPALAIAVEAVMAEAVLTRMGPTPAAFVLTGCLCCLEGVPHSLIGFYLRYGSGFYTSAVGASERLASWLGLPSLVWTWLLALWVGSHLLLGVLSGLVAVGAARVAGARPGAR